MFSVIFPTPEISSTSSSWLCVAVLRWTVDFFSINKHWTTAQENKSWIQFLKLKRLFSLNPDQVLQHWSVTVICPCFAVGIFTYFWKNVVLQKRAVAWSAKELSRAIIISHITMRSCSGFWVMTPVWGISLAIVPESIILRLSQLCHYIAYPLYHNDKYSNFNTYTFIYLFDRQKQIYKNKYSRYTDVRYFPWEINLWHHYCYCLFPRFGFGSKCIQKY